MKKIINLGEKLWASKSAFNYNCKAPYAYIIFEKALTGDVKATSLVFKTIQNEDEEKANLFNDTLNDIFPI